MLSKIKWSGLKPLNQWLDTSTPSGDSRGGARSTQMSRGQYLDFIFNPAVYSKANIATFREKCLKPVAALIGRRHLTGTQEEWKIIRGLVEGSIFGRRMPNFLKSVLDFKERLRLYWIIQAQVEGEVMLQLRSGTNICVCRQSTSAIKEDILLAVEGLWVNQKELRSLLNVAKTIRFEPVHRRIHFYFFDGDTACKHELATIPFKGMV